LVRSLASAIDGIAIRYIMGMGIVPPGVVAAVRVRGGQAFGLVAGGLCLVERAVSGGAGGLCLAGAGLAV
tara:strand:+ start:317 stop:526 length:210 start_codon:yes stop_codon:yes gene_type:complete